jgi:hypothetical protein
MTRIGGVHSAHCFRDFVVHLFNAGRSATRSSRRGIEQQIPGCAENDGMNVQRD